ncbi:DUF1080 domain-containing protein [Puia sp.]|jgi:hypothetical protein|uniref:3-keto-disaccharide hydrolase n=1 Tax=Puia sp. TaxID=2045100 RepID=UPI002F415E22
MKRHYLLILLLAATSFTRPASNPHDGWIPLFNGKNLNGWDTYLKGVGGNTDPQHVFSVVTDGNENCIRISGETTGGLSTKKEFRDYHLQVLFKWGSLTWGPKKGKKKDSGLLYHSVGQNGADNGAWMRSQEFQVEETNTGDYWGCAGATADIPAQKSNDSTYVYDPNGTLYTFRADNQTGRHCIKAGDAEKPTGEWNTLDLYCHGDTAVHVVNGKTLMILYHCAQVDNGQLTPLTGGKIQLQSEGAEIFYKRVRIRPITHLPAEILSK